MNKSFTKFITATLAVFMCFHLASCSSPGGLFDYSQLTIDVPTCSSPGGSVDNSQLTIDVPSETIIREDKVVEDILSPDIISELITKEIYLRELYAVEETVGEMLIQDDRIEEILMTTSIYVPEDHFEDFAKYSGTSSLFKNVDLKPIITKVSIGTGVIITLVALKAVNIDGMVGSIVAAAAPETIKSAALGAGVGTLIGGLVGASEGIDSSGRVAAVVGFAIAVVGVVLSAVSLVAAIPSGGATGIGGAAGVKIALAGIGLAASLVGAGISTENMVKAFSAVDAEDIDWSNIDWNKIGEGAVRQSIQGAANGYLWGAIIGAIQGGAKGLDFYNKHGAPYSKYSERLVHTPAEDGGGRGHWTGKRGESEFVLDEPITLKDGTVVDKISYHNAIPDFSGYAKAQINIPNMTNNRDLNFKQADELLAELWSKSKFNGRIWTPRDVANYRTDNGYTWHEMNNLNTMQLVPTEVNGTWGHLGGVGEYNLFTELTGGSDFD